MGLWKNHARNTSIQHGAQYVNFSQLVLEIPMHHPLFKGVTVNYETLTHDFSSILYRIQELLGFPKKYNTPLYPNKLIKSIPDRLTDKVANFNEIDDKLAKWPCLQSMWRDTDGKVFNDQCLNDLKSLRLSVANAII